MVKCSRECDAVAVLTCYTGAVVGIAQGRPLMANAGARAIANSSKGLLGGPDSGRLSAAKDLVTSHGPRQQTPEIQVRKKS